MSTKSRETGLHRFEAFFGAPRTEIVGKTDYDFVAHQEADLFHAFDLRAMGTGTASVNEEWVTFASDRHRALLETTSHARASGTIALTRVP